MFLFVFRIEFRVHHLLAKSRNRNRPKGNKQLRLWHQNKPCLAETRVNVSDRVFKGKVYVRFFVNYNNELSDITIMTKTNSPSINAELMRCVKLIKIRQDHKIDKEAKIEVIAAVTF